LSVIGEAVERHAMSVSNLLQLGRICQVQKRSKRGALRNTGSAEYSTNRGKC